MKHAFQKIFSFFNKLWRTCYRMLCSIFKKDKSVRVADTNNDGSIEIIIETGLSSPDTQNNNNNNKEE